MFTTLCFLKKKISGIFSLVLWKFHTNYVGHAHLPHLPNPPLTSFPLPNISPRLLITQVQFVLPTDSQLWGHLLKPCPRRVTFLDKAGSPSPRAMDCQQGLSSECWPVSPSPCHAEWLCLAFQSGLRGDQTQAFMHSECFTNRPFFLVLKEKMGFYYL